MLRVYISQYTFTFITKISRGSLDGSTNFVHVRCIEMIIILRTPISEQRDGIFYLCSVNIKSNSFRNIAIVTRLSKDCCSYFLWICGIKVIIPNKISIYRLCIFSTWIEHPTLSNFTVIVKFSRLSSNRGANFIYICSIKMFSSIIISKQRNMTSVDNWARITLNKYFLGNLWLVRGWKTPRSIKSS